MSAASLLSTTGYSVPNGGSIASLQSSVLATGVTLLFAFLVMGNVMQTNFALQIIVTFVIEREEQPLAVIKERLLETSRVLYWFGIATIISIYPPFYAGPHCAVLSWLTLIILIALHVFCIVDSSCKERSVWAYFYFIFHLSVLLWIFIVLVVGYTWSNAQASSSEENL